MGRHSTARVITTFAVATLAIVVAACSIFVAFRLPGIQRRAQQEASTLVMNTVAPRLSSDAGDLSKADLAAFTQSAQALIGNQVRTIRLWSADGELLAAAGAGQAAPQDPLAIKSAAARGLNQTKTSAPGGSVLVSYAPLDAGAVLEVQQDYAPIARSVNASVRELLIYLSIGGVALVFLFPAVLWLTIRGLKRSYERLFLLHQSGQAFRATLDLPDILAQLARDVALFTRAQISLTALVEEPSHDILVRASYDAESNTTSHQHRKAEEWFMRRCAGTGEAVQALVEQFPYFSLLGDVSERPGPTQVLCVAIHSRKGTAGLLLLARSEEQGRFTPAEVEMAQEMASVAAMAVEQATLFAQMRSYAQEVEQGYDSTLRVLSAALDTKDTLTQGHSERVARLTVLLAREMGVADDELVDIERGALLHDVGKIGVPDEVLHKPDALDEHDWEAMQKHPLLAGLMVSKVGFLERALPIILYHHERYDGTGYPFALQGKAIPFEARIFAVVDAFDAMTSDRPYRSALPAEEALEEIRRNAGIQFDPEITEAFLRVMQRQEPGAAEEEAA